MNQKAIEGYFLSFTSAELNQIHECLGDLGYSTDITGLKKFILEATSLEPQPRLDSPGAAPDALLTRVEDFITDNPKTVGMALDITRKILRLRK